MKTIVSQEEKELLERIEAMLASGNYYLTGTSAWKLFSKPKKSHEISFKKKPVCSIVFTEKEVELLESIKKKLVANLENKCARRCAYCKRTIGKYGWSWHVEHIMCKSKNQGGTFLLRNLTAACVDCNFNKNNAVDKKQTPYDIINPNEINFDYSVHLNYFHVATEKICLLKYKSQSESGRNTYQKLKFTNLEFRESLASISEASRIFFDGIDDKIVDLQSKSENHEIAKFLLQIKNELLSN